MLYIGIMSGTSMDGVDVVLCNIEKDSCVFLHNLTYPMPLDLKSDMLQSIRGSTTLKATGELHHKLGLLFANAANALLAHTDTNPLDIIAIGSHGQTLWHEPESQFPFSLQLGDPNIISSKTGIPVVADFRQKDISLGGQGAPFAPAFHAFLFNKHNKSSAVVNIGGMANITILKDKLIGYDTGCGNVLMDIWIKEHKGSSYDLDGEWARQGKVKPHLLEAMLGDEYFSKVYPKSTGREKFNQEWLENILSCYAQLEAHDTLLRGNIQCDKEKRESTILEQVKYDKTLQADIQRTLLELTALSVANEVKKFNIETCILCGGGAQNTFLVERIRQHLPSTPVVIADNADMLEAMAFAWLAYMRIHKESVNLKDVTGASKNAILGGLYL